METDFDLRPLPESASANAGEACAAYPAAAALIRGRGCHDDTDLTHRNGNQMKSGTKRTVSLLLPGLAATLLACGSSGDGSPAGPSGGDPDGGSPDGGGGQAVTLARLSDEIFTPRCATSGCHAGNNPAANLPLGAREIAAAIVDVPSAAKPDYKLVAPGDPVNSYLLMKMRGDEGIAGDRMPPARALEAEQIALVEAWVEAGAPVE